MSEILKAARAEIDAMPREPAEIVSARDISMADLMGPEPFFEIDDGAVHIYWGGYDYDIDLNAIPSQQRFLGWLLHVMEKSWPLMTVERLEQLIGAVCAAKGWDPYSV